MTYAHLLKARELNIMACSGPHISAAAAGACALYRRMRGVGVANLKADSRRPIQQAAMVIGCPRIREARRVCLPGRAQLMKIVTRVTRSSTSIKQDLFHIKSGDLGWCHEISNKTGVEPLEPADHTIPWHSNVPQ